MTLAASVRWSSPDLSFRELASVWLTDGRAVSPPADERAEDNIRLLERSPGRILATFHRQHLSLGSRTLAHSF
jgi:hypothetical protein